MKPTTIQPNYDAIPGELRNLPSWLLWDHRLVNGEWTKVPLIADGSRRPAKSNDHRSWRPYADARREADKVAGIGLCVIESYCGFDLDCCRDKDTGEIAPWARRIIELVNSYTEVSPSGTGVRIFARLSKELPPNARRIRGGKKRYGWEIAVYPRNSPRYLCVTGVVLDGRDQVKTVDPNSFYPQFERGDLDPAGSARATAQKERKRDRLFAGEWKGLYGSQSEADAALVWFLATEHNNDSTEIDKTFRASGLMRPKWDEPRPGGTYGSVTIQKCLDKRRESDAPGMIVSAEGKILPVVGNAIAILRREAEWNGVLAYNLFTVSATTKNPAPWQKQAGGDWSDYDDTKTCEWLQHRGLLVKTNIVAEAVQAIARENPFHPVREYLESLTWDKTPRIESWLTKYMGAPDTGFVRAVGPRWLISAVARQMNPGCQCDHTLILEGPQGLRKSTGLRTLAGDDWFLDTPAELGSKDSRIGLRGVWIVEMGELDKIRKGEQGKVKAYLTNRFDRYRPPYGRRDESFPRCCVFAGSTNDQNPLTDETGGRRFWPVKCGAIDIDGLRRDRDQLWAEAVEQYKAGAVWWLDTAELNELATAEQEARYDGGPWDEIIEAWILDPTQTSTPDGEHGTLLPVTPFDSKPGVVTVTDVLLHAVGKRAGQFTQADQNQVVRCLVHLGWQRDKNQTWIGKERRRRVRFYRHPSVCK